MSLAYLPEHAENAMLGASWLDSAEAFVSARKLRNLLVHEYMAEAELFLESLQAADEATHRLRSSIMRPLYLLLNRTIRRTIWRIVNNSMRR